MEEKKYLGNGIKSIFEIVKLGSTVKIDKGTLVEMTAESARNMNDQLLIQLPLKFQILENDEPKADVVCTLTVNNFETTGIGTTNNDGIVEWDNHKEVSEMMVLPMTCNLSYEDKSVNINITEESDEGSVIQIENGRLKGDDNMIYSLDEQVVGTWIDGRTIYRRSFSCTFFESYMLKDNDETIADHKVSNIVIDNSTGKVLDFTSPNQWNINYKCSESYLFNSVNRNINDIDIVLNCEVITHYLGAIRGSESNPMRTRYISINRNRDETPDSYGYHVYGYFGETIYPNNEKNMNKGLIFKKSQKSGVAETVNDVTNGTPVFVTLDYVKYE